jgi:hypothetical protein
MAPSTDPHMSTGDPTCYRCGGPLTAGLLTEADYGMSRTVRWVSGGPRKGLGGALAGEGSGDRPRYRVETYRCDACGALESFARDPA